MSFMFNPYPYEDPNPVNRPDLSADTVASIVAGDRDVTAALAKTLDEATSSREGGVVIGIDGYVGAEYAPLVRLLTQQLTLRGVAVETVDVATCYKSRAALDEMLAGNLPEDREKDPVLLFGKLFKGGYETLFEDGALQELRDRLRDARKGPARRATILHGAGSCSGPLSDLVDTVAYLDVTPKQAILRIKSGRYKNLGDETARPFKALMRRCYYYDFELAMHLRAKLLRENAIDYYITNDNPGANQLVPRDALCEICASLATYPLRCKPVYLEGVWGGHYLKRIRDLPKEMKNCAWIFDLIPLEVSLLVAAGENTVEIPFFAFVCKEGEALMGRQCVEAFGGYFPIRFNYDDSYHASGNMSIQVHPTDAYIKENFDEHGRQDESYYVVATGQGAKTYLGFNEDADPAEFIAAAKKSETNHTPVDYRKYVNHVVSRPGTQVMIPSGTIHSSGRNQVVLEIGSLTVGSYTFKMYDYLRQDLDGTPRPIHSYHGERVLQTGRTTSWVKDNIVQQPRAVRSGEGWAEYVIGEHDLLYFCLRRYEFEKRIEGDTNGVFHVLTLVDGERVAVYARDDPSHRYEQNYLDVVVVPANVGPYVIENLGNQPVCVHKTHLKENFRDCL